MENPQDLKHLELNFVDSIKDQFNIIDETERKKISENYDGIIRIWTSFLAALRWQIQDLERQIENERNRPLDVVLNRDEFLEFCEAFLEFYRNYVRLVFFQVDVTTAYKHLKLAETDWEYRFFARRIYTLMYETYGSDYAYLKFINPVLNSVRRYCDESAYTEVTNCQRKLRKFLQKNKTVIEYVRVKNEAHKSFRIDELFDAVENLSVKESFALIEEYKQRLDAFFRSLVMLHKSLDEYNNKARTVQMIGPVFMTGFKG